MDLITLNAAYKSHNQTGFTIGNQVQLTSDCSNQNQL